MAMRFEYYHVVIIKPLYWKKKFLSYKHIFVKYR